MADVSKFSADGGSTILNIKDATARTQIGDIWSANGELGAKNLLPFGNIKFSHSSDNITVTNNGDNGITISGQKTSGHWSDIQVLCNEFTLKANISYKLSCVGIPSYVRGIRLKDANNNDIYYMQAGSTSEIFTPNSDLVVVRWNTVLATNDAVNDLNFTYYPMIRLASDPDSTYQPYAMTNRELTDYLTPEVINALHHSDFNNYFNWADGGYKYIKIGNICEVQIDDLNVTQAFTMPTWKQLFYDFPATYSGIAVEGLEMTINRDRIIQVQFDSRNANPTGTDKWGISFPVSVELAVNDKLRLNFMYICK